MGWVLAALPAAVVGGFLAATGKAHAAIAAYHLLCVAVILGSGGRSRPLFAWDTRVAKWTWGTTAILLGGMGLALLLWNPGTFRPEVRRALFPENSVPLTFMLFALYTMIVHVPLEELYWRKCVLGKFLGSGEIVRSVAANAAFFYLMHAVGLALVLGRVGWALAGPSAAAGAVWAWVTIRTSSLWPALASHWAVDTGILLVVWHYYV